MHINNISSEGGHLINKPQGPTENGKKHKEATLYPIFITTFLIMFITMQEVMMEKEQLQIGTLVEGKCDHT